MELVGGTLQIGQAALIAAAVRWGDVLYLSGRTAADAQKLEVSEPDFGAQARLILDQTFALLEASGSGSDLIIRVECYLADTSYFADWNRVWDDYFPSAPPARTTVVTGLALPGLLLELQVTAGVRAAYDVAV